MSGLWSAGSIGQVWLTAAMTLVAGMPQIECRCPREVLKPHASGQACPACCCGEGCSPNAPCCCQSHGGAPVEQTQMHEVVPHRSRQAQGTQQELNRPQCVKALAQPETYSPTPATTIHGDYTTPGAYLPTAGVAVVAGPGRVRGLSSWGGQPLSPPLDLITLHQHFVI
jgi:hypothetical protein